MTNYPNRTRGRSFHRRGDWDASGITADALVLRDGQLLGANGKPYDLKERTALFGEAVIRLAKRMPRNPVNDRLIGQLVGAATSVGANYCEADDGVSRKDFKNRSEERRVGKECRSRVWGEP